MSGRNGNRLLDQSIESATDVMSKTPVKRAVIYLRVSSAGQLNTDIDRDGFSLPAQRQACMRKAATLGATVIEEFVERGESGKSTLRRTALTAMLERIDRRDIDLVVVHKVDRLARKRADDALILERIRAAGAHLVSVSENIDETPSGMLLHGIMASIAEFYSMNLAAEVLKGTTEKARRGGTPYRAPIGYLNARDTIDGHEVRTIAVDPDCGPFIRDAFALYATGQYSLIELAAILEAKGFRTPNTPKRPPREIAANRLNTILHNPFYTGIVTYRGESHPGRHEPLVDDETFETVQRVMESRRQSGERPSRHHHFLRGTLVCHECGGRLMYTRNRGNGGVYEYFSCVGRVHRECSQGHHRVEAVMSSVERYYERLQFSAVKRERILREFDEFCNARVALDAPRLLEATNAVAALKQQEKKLLKAHYADEISQDIFSEEQTRIRRERIGAERTIKELSVDDETLKKVVRQAIALTDRIQTAYIMSNATEKRLFNQAFFEWISIENEEVVDCQLAQPFADLLPFRTVQPVSIGELAECIDPQDNWGETAGNPTNDEVLVGAVNAKTGDPFSKVAGLDFASMVELAGFEPATFRLRTERSTN